MEVILIAVREMMQVLLVVCELYVDSMHTKLKFSFVGMNVVHGCSIMFAHRQKAWQYGTLFSTLTTTKVGEQYI